MGYENLLFFVNPMFRVKGPVLHVNEQSTIPVLFNVMSIFLTYRLIQAIVWCKLGPRLARTLA
jgi:hypothetical protein